MKKTWRGILFVLLFILLIVSAIAGQDFLFTNLIQPVASMAWLIIRTFLSVDQAVYWTLLILIGAVIGIRLIPSLRNPPSIHKSYSSSRLVDRAAYWNDLIRSAGDDQRSREELQHELEKLSISAELVVDGSQKAGIGLPPVRLHPGRLFSHIFERTLHSKLLYTDEELNHTIESILDTLESNLETNHDGKSIEHNDK